MFILYNFFRQSLTQIGTRFTPQNRVKKTMSNRKMHVVFLINQKDYAPVINYELIAVWNQNSQDETRWHSASMSCSDPMSGSRSLPDTPRLLIPI